MGRRVLDVVVIGASPYERSRLVWRLDRSNVVVAGVGGSAADAARALDRQRPAAAILLADDLGTAARWRDALRARWLGLGVVVVGAVDPACDPGSVLADGPVAVLVPDASAEALEWAVRAVAGGRSVIGLAADVTAAPADRDVTWRRARSMPSVTPEGLTPAECAVLEALARGLTNDEIADEMGISRHTVKTHVCHVTEKLGANNRTDAARLYLRGRAG